MPRPVNKPIRGKEKQAAMGPIDRLNESLMRRNINARFSNALSLECYKLFTLEDFKKKCDFKPEMARECHRELYQMIRAESRERNESKSGLASPNFFSPIWQTPSIC